jgi:hypothetical protein
LFLHVDDRQDVCGDDAEVELSWNPVSPRVIMEGASVISRNLAGGDTDARSGPAAVNAAVKTRRVKARTGL